MSILALDANWMPHRWVSVEDAITYEAKNLVSEHLGMDIYVYHGGRNRQGERSILKTNSIIVLSGAPNARKYKEPALNNESLFNRDRHMCAYCGGVFKDSQLTRDHIQPLSLGGKDRWMNVVTACKRCNNLKGDLAPGQKLPNGMFSPQGTKTIDPLYVPYVPCKAEYMILKNRKIKADQMEFLLSRIENKQSRLLQAFQTHGSIWGS